MKPESLTESGPTLVRSWICCAALLTAGAAGVSAQDQGVIADLRDFTETEVRGAGFVLKEDATIHISALGGGDRVFWREMFDNAAESRMFASGWIIDAETREVVWEMTMDNTSGRSSRRTFDGAIELTRGAYEAYYAAHGYYHSSLFSSSSINIDRRKDRPLHRWSDGSFFGIVFGDGDDLYAEFMENAAEYGMTLSVEGSSAGHIQRFEVPREPARLVFRAAPLGDRSVIRKQLIVSSPVTIHIYALGEGRWRDEIYDYGWIVNSETRERVWDMNDRKVRYAGGAPKNIKWVGNVPLEKGTYELTYITDDSHSADDWNNTPPYDPLQYGISISVSNDRDASAIKVGDVSSAEKNVIVSLLGGENSDFQEAGFSLKAETNVRIYALGERGSHGELVDHGWILDARSRKKVWVMEDRKTHHAGGASKNRLVDQIITLPAGDYLACYETDDSHSAGEWNADPPFDEKKYGMTIYGVGEDFDPRTVKPYSKEEDKHVLVRLIKVGSGEDLRTRFTVARSGAVRVYALGEGTGGEMHDYGWITDARTGKVVWEMTYRMTERAGGARKNRVVDTIVHLERGDYELHYRTDDSHAFDDWNDDPPSDRANWGITIFKE